MRRLMSGFSLIEVLVAFAILTTGLMGVASVLLAASKSSTSDYLQVQAAQLAQNLVDAMRQNMNGVNADAYASFSETASQAPAQPSQDCLGTACTPQQLAAHDLYYWATTLQTELPNSRATLKTAVANGLATVKITINWDEQALKQSAPSTASYELDTLL